MAPHTEQVLGIARALVPGGLGWRGVRGVGIEPYLAAIALHGSFRPRPEAETDPSWKQVIPYLVLRDGDRVFLMRRTRAGGDERLHERYTIGIGGHVNPGDTDPLDALRREWAEEIDADFEPTLEPLGVLNDDDNAVGTVHIGLVYSADATVGRLAFESATSSKEASRRWTRSTPWSPGWRRGARICSNS